METIFIYPDFNKFTTKLELLLTKEKPDWVRHLEFCEYPLPRLNVVSPRLSFNVSFNVCCHDNRHSTVKMAAYIATHDRSVLAKPHEDTKVSVTQNTTHKDIIGRSFCENILKWNVCWC